MNGNKYSNFLTMLLVMFIVAILGIIVYFGYDILTTNQKNADAQIAIEEFDKATSTVKKDGSNFTIQKKDEKKEETEEIDRSEALNSLNQASSELLSQQNNQQSSDTAVYMEEYEVVGHITIPKTNCKQPILDKITKRSLEIGVGLAQYGEGLNKIGNSVIFGHNYRNSEFFSKNKNLTIGDEIYIKDKSGEIVTYEVYNVYETDPNDADYFTRDTEGRREISLQTCTDDSKGRLIIWAKEKI